MRRAGAFVVLLVLAASVGCRRSSPPPLSASYRGCRTVERGPVCRVPVEGATLTLWVFAPCDAVETKGALTPIDGGCRVVVVAAQDVSIDAGGRRFVLDVEAGPLAEDAATRASSAAREHLRSGRWEEAVALLDRSAEHHRSAGRTSAAVLDLQAAAFALAVSLHRLGDAAERLDLAEPLLPGFSEGAGLQPYYRGLLAQAAGDPISAHAAFVDARRTAVRLGLDRFARGIREQEAVALRLAGRHREARALAFALVEEADDAAPCDRARLLENVTWVELLDADAAARAPLPVTLAWLDEAQRLEREEGCGSLTDRGNLVLQRALAGVLSRDRVRAREALTASSTASPDLALRYWRAELFGRLHLLEGDHDGALRHLEAASREATDALFVAGRWRAKLWRGRVHDAAGDSAAAVEAYARAEVLLDDEVLRIPVEAGGAALLAERRGSARALAAHHLERGETSRALCVLRRARSRRLATLARHRRLAGLSEPQRARWYAAVADFNAARADAERIDREGRDRSVTEQRAHHRLREEAERRMREAVRRALAVLGGESDATCSTPQPGELLLAAFADGHVFAADDREVTVARAPEDLAAFDAQLERSARVRVLTEGGADLRSRWRGRPLAELRPVAHSLDLPGPRADAQDRGLALVIADPRSNLPGARAEGRAVRARLVEHGWTVELLEGKAADTDRVRQRIESADLLHFAGHAAAAEHLELADGALELEDILMSRRVPRYVVLSGCRTAVAADGLDLAQAFLLAGASQVAASPDDLEDAVRDVVELYGESPGSLDLAEGAHRLAERGADPLTVWIH